MTAKSDNSETHFHLVILDFLRHALPPEAAQTLIHLSDDINLQFIWLGRFRAIEATPEGEYQRPVQRDRQLAVIAAGGHYQVCRSKADVRETLERWLVPSREEAVA